MAKSNLRTSFAADDPARFLCSSGEMQSRFQILDKGFWIRNKGLSLKTAFVRSRMSNGSGVTMYGRPNYLDVRWPDRIVYPQEFCNKHEHPSRHPQAPTWPAAMLTNVTLRAEGPEQTRVRLQWAPYCLTTAEDVTIFVAARFGMTADCSGSFEKLDRLLERWWHAASPSSARSSRAAASHS
jgi:hypothetical protein